MDHFPGIVYFSLVLFPERVPVMTRRPGRNYSVFAAAFFTIVRRKIKSFNFLNSVS